MSSLLSHGRFHFHGTIIARAITNMSGYLQKGNQFSLSLHTATVHITGICYLLLIQAENFSFSMSTHLIYRSDRYDDILPIHHNVNTIGGGCYLQININRGRGMAWRYETVTIHIIFASNSPIQNYCVQNYILK